MTKSSNVEYKTVIVLDNKNTMSHVFGDNVGKKINEMAKKGWILANQETISRSNFLMAGRVRLTFRRGGDPVQVINQSQPSAADELTKLASLLEKGLITREEFEKKKKDLI